jgi:type IV pilus assembly protein PilB
MKLIGVVIAHCEQKETGEELGNMKMDKCILEEAHQGKTIDFTTSIPHIKLMNIKIDSEAVKLLSPQMMRLRKVLPVARNKHSITIAITYPLNHQVMDDVRMATGLEVIPIYADEKEITTTISQFMAFRMDPDIEKILGELQQSVKKLTTGTKESQTIKVDDDAPIIRIVNSLLLKAVQVGCSDIHIEAQQKDVRIRFRVDGELYPVFNLSKLFLPALVSRIKIMAGMDISEKRLPQDGRCRTMIEEREVDFRISTLPTCYGEKVVMRVLDRANALTDIERLGLSAPNMKRLHSLSQRPHGMILVTGATGSGKTTTLYALLSKINSTTKNIITLEDPIEYSLPGINQVQVNTKAGLTFAGGLGAILRQDPDIIMVGEIRDHATAQLAVQAALTGHLVLSTLHTNSAAGTVARLAEMGIEGYLLATSLAGVVSQRLVRRLCEHCRIKYTLDERTAEVLGIGEEKGHEFYRPVGCNMCRQLGYQGRIALQELMLMGPLVRTAVNRGANSDEIQAVALEEGMISIRHDGLAKARQGLTSLEEIIKAVFLEE